MEFRKHVSFVADSFLASMAFAAAGSPERLRRPSQIRRTRIA